MIAMTTPVAVKGTGSSKAADGFASAIEKTFEILTSGERKFLLQCANRQHYLDQETILEEGSSSEAIYILAEGEVRIERQGMTPGENGKPAEVARLEQGAVFGEMSFVDKAGASASVVAAGRVVCLRIDGATIHTCIQHDPTFAGRFYHSLAATLSRRLRATSTRLIWEQGCRLSGQGK